MCVCVCVCVRTRARVCVCMCVIYDMGMLASVVYDLKISNNFCFHILMLGA